MPGTQADGKDQSKGFEHSGVQRMEIKLLLENEGLFIKRSSFEFWVHLPLIQTINAVSMIFCLGSSKHLT